jgi:hypothetical protein
MSTPEVDRSPLGDPDPEDDRLAFRLPEFTRTSWVSAAAREEWAPCFERIGRAWGEIEWLSVAGGVRPCGLVSIAPPDYAREAVRWAAGGVLSLPLRIEGMSRHSYASESSPPEPGKPYVFRVILSRSLDLAMRLAEAWRADDDDMIGELLGYPSCCRRAFVDVRSKRRCTDTTWQMAVSTARPVPSPDLTVELAGAPFGNVLWRWMGVRAVPHLPCRFDCRETLNLGRKLLDLGAGAGYVDEMDCLKQVLSWPVEWSALHGIAEIKTPIMKVSTRTDATARKRVVRFQGEAYPEAGASGLRFPYRSPSRAVISGSPGFGRGLRNDLVQLSKPLPEWYHRDNGFSSRHAMEQMHVEIVALARSELSAAEGDVMELGCGNAALLGKICDADGGLVPHGIDLERGSIEHARALQPRFAENFMVGDLFDLTAWPRGRPYVLSIFMIGRLLEASRQRADALLAAVRGCSARMLVYAYPGFSRDTLDVLAGKLKLRLREGHGSIAGLVADEG